MLRKKIEKNAIIYYIFFSFATYSGMCNAF